MVVRRLLFVVVVCCSGERMYNCVLFAVRCSLFVYCELIVVWRSLFLARCLRSGVRGCLLVGCCLLCVV